MFYGDPGMQPDHPAPEGYGQRSLRGLHQSVESYKF
jgi:hypothetical protein